MSEKNLRWMKLDNAGLIYPAAKRKQWINFFRMSVTLKENIDPSVLQNAIDKIAPRFPSICVRLRKGMFWYYLEEIPEGPKVMHEGPCPLVRESAKQLRKYAVRIIYYKKRIAVEYFHSVTDGTGALIFLKSLAAEYIRQMYGEDIPCEDGVLSPLEAPRPEELEDCFHKIDGKYEMPRDNQKVYKLRGTPSDNRFLSLTTGELSSDELYKKSKEYGVTVTEFLGGVMLKALIEHQNIYVKSKGKQREVRVLIPVNLRRIFGYNTLRNFSQYVIPGVDPKLGEYTLEELCKAMHYQMGSDITPQKMAARVTSNTKAENMLITKIPPLFVKNIVMKMVYNKVGEKTSCLNISNLGVVKIPEAMQKYVDRFDFIIGPPAMSPNNCSVISYNGRVYINFIRNVKESELERLFFTNLVKLGLHVKVQSNRSEVYE